MAARSPAHVPAGAAGTDAPPSPPSPTGSSSDLHSMRRLSRTASFGSFLPGAPVMRTNRADGDDSKQDKLWSLMSSYLAGDVHTIQRQIVNHVEYTLASTRFNFDSNKAYRATAHSVRDRLIESWNDTNQFFDEHDVKRVNYLSLEYLVGRSMQNALLNMDLEAPYREALRDVGFALEDLYDREPDAALGNGGLGRLAACFLDSMATLDLPAWGYGLRYNYGIFRQEIKDGAQVEVPDYWLTLGNPWEIERIDVSYPVRFYGSVSKVVKEGKEVSVWEGGETVIAVAYDNPVPGYDTYNTINLRLWRATPSTEFDLESFNSGDYMTAVAARARAETITQVLYPSDSTYNGKELRLKQQYFFVAATLHDIIRRFKKHPRAWSDFPKKNAIQLNDTHPSIGIAELMRILLDEEGLEWAEAWDITNKTFAYTNHTILPEALERWSVDMLGHLLPRHLQIIYDINWFFLQEVERRWPGDVERLRNMSIVEEHGYSKMIRMANLSIVGSHAVNGVAALHTELVKNQVFPEFYEMWPEKFQNKTNGVTPRRWINEANPGLAAAITKCLDSPNWLTDLSLLAGLRPLAHNPEIQGLWQSVKQANKHRLAAYIKRKLGIVVPEDAMFDVQVKRFHEYKRQLLNCMYCIHRYLWLKSMKAEERAKQVKRVVIFAGKAAPSYTQAKNIIKLIHAVAAVVNTDSEIGDVYKVVFLPNYNVSLAEIIVPASDLSQHISTAGMEASGTSNMKFAMNAGLIIGTMDGANIEISAEIGEENMFIFGALADEVNRVRYQMRFGKVAMPPCVEWDAVMTAIKTGTFGLPEKWRSLLDALEPAQDYYLLRYDFPKYLEAQAKVDNAFRDPAQWYKMCIMSTAGMGYFSTDRTIAEYARDIWSLEPHRHRRPDPLMGETGVSRSRSFANFDPNVAMPHAHGSGGAAGSAL